MAAAGLSLHAPMAAAQRSALGNAQAPQRPVAPAEPRDRASQIINPHLGPRWPNGQLRDGASQIINPPVQPAYSSRGESGIPVAPHALGGSREERRNDGRDGGRRLPDRQNEGYNGYSGYDGRDASRWQDPRDEGIYRR